MSFHGFGALTETAEILWHRGGCESIALSADHKSGLSPCLLESYGKRAEGYGLQSVGLGYSCHPYRVGQ